MEVLNYAPDSSTRHWIKLDEWNQKIDTLTQSPCNDLAFAWMRIMLLDKLQKEATAERQQAEAVGRLNEDDNRAVQPKAITQKQPVPDTTRYVPYVSGDTVYKDRQPGVFVKRHCAAISQDEVDFVAPEPKPYPFLDAGAAHQEDLAGAANCPDFQIAFALYSSGKLPLNFLYLFWGKNLGSFFKETFSDIISFYRSFGATTFKRAIRAMLASMKLPANSLDEMQLEADMDTLDRLAYAH